MSEQRTPSQETVENTVAIGKLITISERTTLDVDKIIKHIEKILPVHERISNLKKILYSSIACFGSFAIWIALAHFAISEKVTVHEAEEKIYFIDINERINENKSQNKYLLGRIK